MYAISVSNTKIIRMSRMGEEHDEQVRGEALAGYLALRVSLTKERKHPSLISPLGEPRHI
jgi:hypothetical protein